ncbi:MAG: beta-glucoside-specific PTS transporter subunit IIABC [Eubacterium sp.]
MDIRKCAEDILKNIGGKENIKDLTHCFTRLRFVLKDRSKVDKETIEHTEGVIQVVEAGGQFQVVLGSKVEKVYNEISTMIDLNALEGGEGKEKTNIGNLILQTVSKMFTPLIPAIAAAGLIKGLLTAAKLIAQNAWGVDISSDSTYVLLYAASQVIFYFMPIFLGYTAAKALKCNEIISMMVGAFLVYPDVDKLVQDVSTITKIFDIPIVKGSWTIGDSTKVFSYTESVIPILLCVFVLYWIEKFLKKYIPQILQIILVPGISLVVMIPLALCVLGPVGIYIGNGIQTVYYALMNFNAVLGGAVVGGLWGVLVIFGAHRALLPIGLNDVAVSGKQNLLAFAGAANFAQGGAALGVWIKTKNEEMKGVSASATISATLVGITEPAIYGCNLRLKRPMVAAIIAGAIGGGIMGAGGVYGDAFANNGVLTIFTYASFGLTKFAFYLAGIAIAFFGAAILTIILGFEDIPDKNAPKKIAANQDSSDKEVSDMASGVKVDLGSPIEGEAVDLSKTPDEVFASGSLGKGVALIPSKGEIVAPADCTVSLIYPSMHAIGLSFDNSIDMLIHVGINTVELNGKYFKKYVEEGARVKRGTKILSFDINAIKKAGYDTTVPILIGNTDDFTDVEGHPVKHANMNTTIITVTV